MERILVIGSGGAGKSTLARRMGQVLDLPVVHLDVLFWKPGWIETPRPEFERKFGAIIEGPRWVMDGNYSGTLELRIRAADSVVFLDFPPLLCLWRVIA